MTGFPYQIEGPKTPAMGLIVLSVDGTVEQELRHYIPNDAARLFVSRIPAGDELTRDGLIKMEAGIANAAALFPSSDTLDVVGFACTSGTAVLGAKGIGTQVANGGCVAKVVTDPLTATFARASELGVARMGIVSPYVADVVAPLCKAFSGRGIAVPDTLSFGEKTEARVARIAPGSIIEAAIELAARTDMDGVFLSCTNLRTAGLLRELETKLGMPVLSSNHSLAWHMSKLAGMPAPEIRHT